MAYKADPAKPQFRALNDKEENEFRLWARKYYEPDFTKRNVAPFKPDPEVHHPVIVDECSKMDGEFTEILRVKNTKAPYGKV